MLHSYSFDSLFYLYSNPLSQLPYSILTAMISGGNSLGINNEDVRFTMNVLKDAKKLKWKRGELYKHEMAVKGVCMGRISEAWKEDEDKYGMGSNGSDARGSISVGNNKGEKELDPLFKKKNWNEIDSGFRLWGGTGSFDGGSKKKKKLMNFWSQRIGMILIQVLGYYSPI